MRASELIESKITQKYVKVNSVINSIPSIILDIIEIALVNLLNVRIIDGQCHAVSVFFIKPAKCSFPSWIEFPASKRIKSERPNDAVSDSGQKTLNIRQFFIGLLKSDMMGFKQPQQSAFF